MASGYRISDPPPPDVFELAQKKPMRGLITLAGVLALAGIVALLTGGVFTVLVAFGGSVGSAFGFLFAGGPRRIEVFTDRVRVHFWLTRPSELLGSHLEVQLLPGELWLVTPKETIELDPEQLGGAEKACKEALRRVARETVTVTPRAQP